MRVVFDVEEWRDCVDFPDRYEISNLGNLRSKAYLKQGRNRNGPFQYLTTPKLISARYNLDGYLNVSLQINGVKSTAFIHRLIAKAFIPNPENKATVNHKNSVRDDNRIENLEWVTFKENVQHGYDSGSNSNAGEFHPSAILNDVLVLKIKHLQKEGYTCKEISDLLGFKYHTVSKIMHGVNWRHIKLEEKCA